MIGNWTPIDASGAGLTLTVNSAVWVREHDLVHVSADIQYPTTANGANARIGGLPWYTVNAQSALTLGYHQMGLDFHLLVRGVNTVIDPVLSSGAVLTNAQLSARNLVFSGTYRAYPFPTVLSGQSNADNLTTPLAALTPVTNISAGATAVSAWALGGAQWIRLAPVLVPPLQAFVWWQGESDEGDLSGYANALGDLMLRVRQTAQQPNLPVIICGANSYPNQQPLRDIQMAYASGRPNTLYVPSDDLPSETNSQHLTAAGYMTMAARVQAAVQNIR